MYEQKKTHLGVCVIFSYTKIYFWGVIRANSTVCKSRKHFLKGIAELVRLLIPENYSFNHKVKTILFIT